MTEAFWGTTNLKVAAVASALGAELRKFDPVTHQIFEDGSKRVTFWFNTGKGVEAKEEMEKSWAEMKGDEESPIRYMRAALENRETLLGLVKRAEPVRIIQRGEQTLYVSENAKPELKKALLSKL
jgi:hypothetical protein